MLEIERKYLLSSMPEVPVNATSLHIEQGYLPLDHDPPGRLRRTRRADGTLVHHLTLKKGDGLVREEIERELDAETFARFWPATEGRRLIKRRWVVPVADHPALRWEIDEFLDRALVLLEIELPDPAFVVEPPPFLVRCIDREVTDDPAYRNAALAGG